MMKYRILLLLLVNGLFVYAQLKKNPCLASRNCGDCLRASGECAFCEDEDYTKGNATSRTRCNYASELKFSKCQKIMNIQGSSIPVTQKFGSTKQISPIRISLKLRPDLTEKFKIYVKPAKDFPVDLYYLMDMSKSMSDDLKNLVSLGTNIADEIGKVTPNYRLAFGSFVDKSVPPYIQPVKLPIQKTFGFKHVLDFTNDKTEFVKEVNKQDISGNLDTPEGGFDALMQVATCNNTLKMVPVLEAHRIAVFVTDASPHIAGDGRLGGILKPNDAHCHLSSIGSSANPKRYTETNKQDYPSISKLKAVLKENDIIPIFAVTKEVQTVYQKLGSEWKELNAAVGTLKGDSSNIVELIREKYSEIIKTIRLSDNSPKGIVVKYKADSSCKFPSENGDVCTKIEAGDTYVFDVSVTAISCPKDPKEWGKVTRFTINAPGLGKIDVDVTMICDCACEKGGVAKSPKCKNFGTFKCGICYCDDNRFGEICQCDDKQQGDDSKCRKDDKSDVVCSGAGSCICGKCECNRRLNKGEIIDGKFCECNNYGCDRYNGKLCGGVDRGSCVCGRCKCTEAYLGDNCGEVNCTIAEKNCFNQDGIKCSGHGSCNCDTCDCEKGYDGKFCENCVSCPTKCTEYKDCVQCTVWNEGPLAEGNKCDECKKFNIKVVNETDTVCEYKDDNNCFYHFKFEQNPDGNETIIVQKNKRCVIVYTKPTPILAIVLGIIGGLILLALILLLLWKLLITAYDNYEYQKFLKENQNPNWANTNNPIYKPSQTNYQNPTYAGK